MTKQSPSKLILQGVGFVFGLVSILGGIAAWSYGSSREPERYFVSVAVMMVGGIIWMISSIFTKYQLTGKQINIILVTLVLGLILGLFYTFSVCGGECGLGASFCRWERGYPGRWLITGGCHGPTDAPGNFQLTMRNWRIDRLSLLADVVFWSAAGMILAFLRQIISRKINQPLLNDL